MKKEMIAGLKIFALLGSTLLLMTACATDPVQVAPPQTVSVTTSEDTTQARTTTETMPDEESIRQARLQDLEEPEKSAPEISIENIYFDYDRSDLSEQALTVLKKIAVILQPNPSYALDISGHCDERGTIEYNLALGDRRARQAKKFLTDLGISGDRISTISYGEERPVDPRSDEAAWAKNRRAEFMLIK